jgi:tetratricopeptide (TPR) repeat protein
MGIIYRGTDTVLAREVAIKVLQEHFAPDSGTARRFADEARITAQLQHPAIPPVHDLGTLSDGRPFLAMKLIKGQTLEALLAARPDVPAERGRYVAVFEQVCQAIGYAHSHGVIHRDLKPANVMVGAFGEVQVMDWGLAKVLGSSPTVASAADETSAGTVVVSLRDSDALFTQAGSVLGTPAFMPPEQAVGAVAKVDRRSDVFGLGAILAVILTGQPPFAAASAETTRVKAAQGDVADCLARLDVCGAEPELVALCKGCLSPKPVERPADAGEVARAVAELRAAADERARLAELERVKAEGEKAAAAARALERRKRRRLWLGAAAALVLAALGGLGAVLAVQRRANADLEAKNAELADEQAKVQARFELAQRAIATFHTGVSEDALLKNDQFTELRTKLLKEAAGFYSDLEQLLEGQTDVKSRQLLAAGYFKLGELTVKIGSKPEGLAVHRKALAERRELAAVPGADLETRLDVARSLRVVGNLLDTMGDHAAAQAACEEQRDIALALTAESATDAVRAVLASSYHNIGGLLSDTGKPADALVQYEKAQTIYQQLAETSPGVKQFQSDLARNHSSMGLLQSDTGNLPEALAEFEKARAIRQRLVDGDPSDAEFLHDLANSHNNLGHLLSDTGKPREALEEFEKARVIQQKLADGHPAVTRYQSDVANDLNSIGLRLSEIEKPEDAMAAFERARKIQQQLAEANPTVTQFRRDLGSTNNNIGLLLAHMGKSAEAMTTYEKAREIFQQLADANPAVTEFQLYLANTHHNIGNGLAQAGKLTEALMAHQKALAVRQKLADANSTIAQVQMYLGRSHSSLGHLRSDAGNPAGALAEFEKALAIRQQLADAHPATAGYQRDLAASHMDIGILLSRTTGKQAAAIAEYEKSLAVRQKLADDHPAVASFASDVAGNYNDLGVMLSHARKPAEAVAAYEKALGIYQPLVDANPGVAPFQAGLAGSYGNYGLLLASLRKRAEAEAQYRKALAIQDQLATQFPAVARYQITRGGTYCNLGMLIRDSDQPGASLEWFGKAIGTLGPLYEHNSRQAQAKQFLTSSHKGRAEAYDRLQQYAEAVNDWDRAIQLGPRQQQGTLRVARARSQVSAGQVAAGVAQIAELAKNPDWPAVAWYDFARVCALASSKSGDMSQQYSDRAMTLLQKAVKAGYKDTARVKADADLDSLRGREDFKKLIQEMEKQPAARSDNRP